MMVVRRVQILLDKPHIRIGPFGLWVCKTPNGRGGLGATPQGAWSRCMANQNLYPTGEVKLWRI